MGLGHWYWSSHQWGQLDGIDCCGDGAGKGMRGEGQSGDRDNVENSSGDGMKD